MENNKFMWQDIIINKSSKNIKFSVIIPVYNASKYLITCLMEIYNQKYDDIEIICVNDGSTDNTEQILEFYSKLKSPKTFIGINKKNEGVSAARNSGLKAATGDYVVFVDADDIINHSMFEQLSKELKKQSPDILVFGFDVKNEGGEIPGWISEQSNSSENYYTTDVSLQKPKPFDAIVHLEKAAKPFVWRQAFKRSLIAENEILFPINFGLGEDNIFLFECYSKAKDVRFITDRLYFYRINHVSAMTKFHLLPNKKFNIHLNLVREIVSKLKKQGNFDEYYIHLIGWITNFLYWDWKQFNEVSRHKYAKEIVSIYADMGLSTDFVYEWERKHAKEIEAAALNEPLSLEQSINSHADAEIEYHKNEIIRLLNTKIFKIGRMLTFKKRVDVKRIMRLLSESEKI